MIIRRYLAREVVSTMAAVTAVVMLIFLLNYFIRYIDQAANGNLPIEAVLTLLLLRLPGLLALVLPLGLFLGLFIALGRLYADQEMAVLMSAGLGQKTLIGYLLPLILLFSAIVAWLNLQLVPWSQLQQSQIFREAKEARNTNSLRPGRFIALPHINKVAYLESIDSQQRTMDNVFIASANHQQSPFKIDVMSAEKGQQIFDNKLGTQYLIFSNGQQYSGTPGLSDYRIVHFDRYGVQLEHRQAADIGSAKSSTQSNLALWHSTKAKDKAELQWRLVLPGTLPLLAIIAIALAKTPPGSGKYARLIPAAVIFMLFYNLLALLKSSVEKGHGAILGLWWLPVFLVLVCWFLLQNRLAKQPGIKRPL